MTDLSREQVIDWCVDNNCDFLDPVFPPPNGWAWADYDLSKKSLILTAIFTNTEDKDITSVDIIKRHVKEQT